MSKKEDRLKKMITASEVAVIWNERAKAVEKETHYTRYSVYAQREKLGGIDTPLGFLYEREKAESFPLPRYRCRPDVAPRNRGLYKKHKRNPKTGQFQEPPVPSDENA